ncbi:XRE family transcriptional regulator [Leptospira santarosai]|uniref:XRE family transcriptional regulator n=1 Tax=Leptospira santarosai TaxID=28183 RepID=UPI0024AF31F8|nr:XRE family transcriptional regulator [Leptospira santarosai]MDI7215724.1 XRE family transcriptional regulator [Leptospira santarosai]
MKIDQEKAKRFGTALEYLKEHQGKSQNHIAKSMDVSSSTLSRIANGKLPLLNTMAVTFEYYTGISSHWLFLSGEGSMFVEEKILKTFSEEEFRFFVKIKKDAELFELIQMMSGMKKDNYEIIKSLIRKLKK